MISEKLLVCTADYYELTGTDADRNDTYADKVELSRIWISHAVSVAGGSVGKISGDTMTLFYDCKNSVPADLEFTIGSRVVYNGREFFVQSISPCMSLNGLHHYEVTLE